MRAGGGEGQVEEGRGPWTRSVALRKRDDPRAFNLLIAQLWSYPRDHSGGRVRGSEEAERSEDFPFRNVANVANEGGG